jgi:hypothetical protein
VGLLGRWIVSGWVPGEFSFLLVELRRCVGSGLEEEDAKLAVGWAGDGKIDQVVFIEVSSDQRGGP